MSYQSLPGGEIQIRILYSAMTAMTHQHSYTILIFHLPLTFTIRSFQNHFNFTEMSPEPMADGDINPFLNTLADLDRQRDRNHLWVGGGGGDMIDQPPPRQIETQT